MDGVVPEAAFNEGVRSLALGEAERERLRHELARMGLPVEETHMHAETDNPDDEKVAGDGGESVFPWLGPLRALLARYADDEGRVTSRVVEGVVRLAGLNQLEAAHLRATTPVRTARGDPGTDASVAALEPHPSAPDGHVDGPTGPETDVSPAGDAQDPQASDPPNSAGYEGKGPVPQGDGATDLVDWDNLAEAVAAAHTVLETDRRVRGSGRRLLSAQAEVGLAVLLRGGPDSIAQEPTEDELKALPADDLRMRARTCLVEHNQRLVHSLVRSHLDQGLDYEDLLQHGYLGLLRAVRKFDPTKGFKFSTYATWWIRQSISRGIADEGALIRIPVHMHEQMRKVAKAERELLSEGRRAGDAEVAVRCDMTLQKVREIRRLTRRTDSLDRVIGDGATLADFVAETHVAPSVEQQVIGALYVDDVLNLVATFPEREARILVRRLGLDGDEPSTLDDLGREFGVTRERIRQIESKAKPALRVRLREAGLVGLDAACARAEREAVRAAEAKKAARIARATRAARTARARLALRRARAERLARERLVRSADDRPAAGAVEVEELLDTESGTQERQAPQEQWHPREPQESPSPQTSTATNVPESPCARPGARPPVEQQAVDADWGRACRLAEAPVDQISWLVDFARAGLGDNDLTAFLGEPAGEPATRVSGSTRLSRPVMTALEVLRRVLDALVAVGGRPGDFFDRPAEVLVGVTPRDYLLRRPLVNRESRLAVRDALREFLAVEGTAPVATGVTDAQEAEFRSPELVPAGPEAGPSGRGAELETVRDMPVAAPPVDRGDTDGDTTGPAQTTADWDKATALREPPLGGGVAWRAEYALLALGQLQLSILLGPSAAASVARAARHRGTLDRPVVLALETLVDIFTAVRARGLRPEHFFESPADRLAGETPRRYLAATPLVDARARLAISDTLREFKAARAALTADTAAGDDDGSTVTTAPNRKAAERPGPASAPSDPAVRRPNAGEPPTTGDHAACEARRASAHRAYERRLGEERSAADERVAAVRAAAEQQIGAWEEVLLARMDVLMLRRERRVRAAAEEQAARLKAQHHDARRALLNRAERAEEAARSAQEQRERAGALDRRLREYQEGAETRIAQLEQQLSQTREAAAERERAAQALIAELIDRAQQTEAALTEQVNAARSAREEYRQGARLRVMELETRLRDAEAALEQRDRTVQAARRRVDEAEQQAARRIAEHEHNAWLRITDLQTRLSETQAQLAAAQEADRSRGILRDRWRRSP
ncbi:sigma-70 family RNA polymerase sigma factor [Streptomyces sp. bgisy022]|uniref:sigma-70 family RNA polymerase sigma factor n=1 Tax=Streptomyces sp. bgisy022 TaxID=3413769 RepID=UPI003D730BF8